MSTLKKDSKATKANPANLITVQQYASHARRPKSQHKILIGLGLCGHIGKKKSLQDTPQIRGMLAKVSHMVHVIDS